VPISKYGFKFPDGTNEVTMELHAFVHARSSAHGGLGQFEHFKNATDLLWNDPQKPTSRNFVWSPWAEDMLYEACDNQYLSIAGCASSGKSDTMALWGIINYLADPYNTLVIVTSTTLREARRRIWKSITELWSAVPGLPGKLVPSLGQIKGLSKDGGFWESTGIVLVPAEKRKEKEAIGKLVGIKMKRLILIADELPELPESLVHAAYTNLSTNPQFQMVGLGNPNSHFDAFGVFSRPKLGWGSVTENDSEWDTSRGKCIRFNAEENPNVLSGRSIYPWMPTRETVEAAKRDYGENSLLFYRMYKGFWCPDGIDSGVYSEADLVRGVASMPANFEDDPIKVAAIDPSFTNGGDRSIVFFGMLGTQDGVQVLQFDDYESLSEDINDKDTPRSVQIARQFRDVCLKRGILPENAACDATGAGGPFHDILSVEWDSLVLPVNFAGKASDRPVSATDKTPGCDRYANRMSEIWYQGQELLRSQQLRGIQTDLAKEMVSRRYETSGTNLKIKVESKIDYKSRVGKSPDIADAAFIVVDLCRTRHGFMGGERFSVNKGRRQTWANKMKSLDITAASHRTLLDT
tara:strand:- start:7990 stop:9723 length:1734 start_codon:yes stop_codon:yes gene_type:complete